MTLLAQIDHDYKSLKSYFDNLFKLLEKANNEEQNTQIQPSDVEATESNKDYHEFSHLIKPDMLLNIYSFLDFWLIAICEFQKKSKNLSLSYKDIKGNNDLHAYRKYLIKYAGLELDSVKVDYDAMNNLRKIRNCYVHRGGHVATQNQENMNKINGISLSASLILVEDEFVWTSLDSANEFLRTASGA